jgi:hypothetical protein
MSGYASSYKSYLSGGLTLYHLVKEAYWTGSVLDPDTP